MKKLLLHICCAPDGVYIPETLQKEYDVTCYFYNPNIFPKAEYEKRAKEMEKVAKEKGYKLIIAEYDNEKFLNFGKGLYYLPEKKGRCELCFSLRLEKTAKLAKELDFDAFSTVLTVSPKKDFGQVNLAGEYASKKYCINYLPSNFKKNNGYKNSIEESQKLNLYRQNYCGCESSLVYRKMFINASSLKTIFFFNSEKIGIFDIQSVKKTLNRLNHLTGFIFFEKNPTIAVLKEAYNERLFIEHIDNKEWRKKIFNKKNIEIKEFNLKDVANRDVFLDPF